MAKHIGIVACSAEGAALCYRTLCKEAPALMGGHRHPEISMHAQSLADYMLHVANGNWNEVAKLMVASARKLASMGAQFVICPDNTIHQAFDLAVGRSPVPWLHIADAVGRTAAADKIRSLAILGSRFLMNGPVYPSALGRFGIACRIPELADRERIDRIIFEELVNGIRSDESRRYFKALVQKLKGYGCEGVVLGCTELPLLVDPEDCPLPTFDSTRLLARAALLESMNEEVVLKSG